ncbi:hypothetical protein, partial [Bradyrhizobium sp.]|uniref:hypothetical protein n=1 Tax=Bradyrhizobium sp. TaxID=376 RepID=UPI003C1D4966
LILSRYTELNTDQKLLLKQLKLDLPPQPPPRITSSQRAARPQVHYSSNSRALLSHLKYRKQPHAK